VETNKGTAGCWTFKRRINSSDDRTSPTETACNQIEPPGVESQEGGKNPSRSARPEKYLRSLIPL
jgi:hypothetical protein